VLIDTDDSSALPREWDSGVAGILGAGGGAEVVAPVHADGSIDWRPIMAYPPPLFSSTGCGSNATISYRCCRCRLRRTKTWRTTVFFFLESRAYH
jgi:hypothetical protein